MWNRRIQTYAGQDHIITVLPAGLRVGSRSAALGFYVGRREPCERLSEPTIRAYYFIKIPPVAPLFSRVGVSFLPQLAAYSNPKIGSLSLCYY